MDVQAPASTIATYLLV